MERPGSGASASDVVWLVRGQAMWLALPAYSAARIDPLKALRDE